LAHTQIKDAGIKSRLGGMRLTGNKIIAISISSGWSVVLVAISPVYALTFDTNRNCTLVCSSL